LIRWLGLADLDVVVVDSVVGLADLGLGLPISTWWWLIRWLGLPISAWVCQSRPRLANLFLLSSGVVWLTA
jgi:hypothetical protein